MPKKLVKSSKLVGGAKGRGSKSTATKNPRIVKDTRPRNREGNVRLENGLVEYVYGERDSVVLWEDRGGRVFYVRPDGGRDFVTESYRGNVFETAGKSNRTVYKPMKSSQKMLIHMDGVQRQLRRLPKGGRVYYKCYRVRGKDKVSVGTVRFQQSVRNLAGKTLKNHPHELFVVEAEVR